MIKINVLSEDNSWSKKLKKKEIFFNKICKYFPKKFQFINKKVYLTILLSNNINIKKLNRIFRNKNNQRAEIDEVGILEDLRTYAVSRVYLDNFKRLDFCKIFIVL